MSLSLGDYSYSRFGKPRNSDLVKMVANMSQTLGRPVATPDQARETLQIGPDFATKSAATHSGS